MKLSSLFLLLLTFVLFCNSNVSLAQKMTCSALFNTTSQTSKYSEFRNKLNQRAHETWYESNAKFRTLRELLDKMEDSGEARKIFEDIPELSMLVSELIRNPEEVIRKEKLNILKKYKKYSLFTSALISYSQATYLIQTKVLAPLHLLLLNPTLRFQGVPATNILTPLVNTKKHPILHEIAKGLDEIAVARIFQFLRPAPFIPNRIEKIYARYGNGNSIPKVFDLLKPFPFLEKWVQDYFKKNTADISEISKEDLDYLVKQDLLDNLLMYREFNELYPDWHLLRKFVRLSFRGLYLVSALLIINHLWYLLQNSMTPEEYEKTVKIIGDDNSIDILIDVNGFTHVAVQIDGQVYSYGQESMSVFSLNAYLNEKADAFAKRKETGESRGIMDSITRQIQAIRINLSPEEKQSFKNALEKSSYKLYENYTFVNDCITMIARKLESNTEVKIPHLINASPSELGMYLTSLLTLEVKNKNNLPLVERIMNVHVETAAHWSIINTVNEVGINHLESNLFIRMMPYLEAYKAYLNFSIPKDKLEYWSPEGYTQLNKFKIESQKAFYQDTKTDYYLKGLKEASAGSQLWGELKEELAAHLNERFKHSIETLRAPNTSIINSFQIEGEATSILDIARKHQIPLEPFKH